MMALISLLGLTALGTSLLEERMAANARDRMRALQAAEAALRSCEAAITPASVFDASGGSGGMYTPSYPPVWENPALWADATKVRTYAGLPLVAAQPACVIERLTAEIKQAPEMMESSRAGLPVETERVYRHYRVTARGVGMNEHTVVMLQSNVRKSD